MTEQLSVRCPLDSLPCAAATADSQLRITAANSSFVKQWAALAGHTGQLPGVDLSQMCSADDRARIRRAVSRRRHAKPQQFAVALAKTTAVVDLTPLDEPGGRWLVTLRDTRDSARSTEALHSIPPSLAIAVAHDMKTPLQAVLGWVSLLRKMHVTAERLDEVLGIVERNARLQAEMLNDLVEATQVDGDSRLECEFVEVAELVRQAIEALRPMAEQARLRMVATFPETPVTVWGDARRLTRAINNLIANAIKFSEPQGTVECRLAVDGRWVKLVVRDHGRGIAPGFLPSVFDPFRRERPLEKLPSDGIGLGLAIVRHVVQLHGGRVQAESAGPGLGATFTVTLPWVPHSRVVSMPSRSRARC